MTSDNSLSLILHRLDEIERKLDHVLEELRTPPPSAIRCAGVIFQARITSRSPILAALVLGLGRRSLPATVQGKSMFLAFQYGVMYVLSSATIITVFATAIALLMIQ